MKGRKEKELIQKLGQMFEAPPPKRKEIFLRSQRPPRLHLGHLLAVQLTYLPKWVWLLFSGGFLVVLYAGRTLQMDMLWIAGALVPFLVLVSVTESFRSMSCGMEELEMAARFSLSGILLARMGILGLGNLAWMLGVAALVEGRLPGNVLFLMAPYLMTDFGCLMVVRRLKGRDGLYACGGVAAAVCCIELTLSANFAWIWEARYLGWWLAAVGVLLFGNLWQGFWAMYKTEEYVWN